MIKKLLRILKSEKAEATYISTVVYIFVAMILIAFIINIFSVISTKQQLDAMVDQLTKQVQLSGGMNSSTEELFDFLCDNITGSNAISYELISSYYEPIPSGMDCAIQLGTPFYITATADVEIGGFWNIGAVELQIESKSAGVSEQYWK